MFAALALVPDWIKLPGAAVLGAAISFAPIYFYGKHEAAAEIQLAATKDALARIQKMEKENATFKNLPAHDRCVAFMRDSGLPVGNCD